MSAVKQRKIFSNLQNTALDTLGIVLASLLIGFLTYQLSSFPKKVVPFWPLSGIALYLYLRRGLSVLPGLFLGVLLLTYSFTDRPLVVCLTNAVFNTLETYLAGLIYHRLERYRDVFGDFLSLPKTLIAAAIPPLPSAIAAAVILGELNHLSEAQAIQLGIGWWLGHFVGIIIFAPLLEALPYFKSITFRQWMTFSAAAIAVGVMESIVLWNKNLHAYVFLIFLSIFISSYFLPGLLLQFLGMLLSFLAIDAYIHGGGINSNVSDFGRIFTMQAFMSMVFLNILFLAAFRWDEKRTKFAPSCLFVCWIFFGALYAILKIRAEQSESTLMLFVCLATVLSLCLTTFVQYLESNAQQSKAMLLRLMNSVPIGIFRSDRYGNLTVGNQEWCRLIGHSSQELSGKRWLDAIHPQERDALRSALDSIATTGSVQGEFRLASLKGEKVVDLKVVCEDSNNSSDLALLGIVRDVSEIKAARDALEMQRAVITHSAKLASLGKMAAGIAHEINNPLAVIHAQSYMMRTKLSDGRADTNTIIKTFTDIEETLRRISRITRALLEFSGVPSHPGYREKLSLKQIVETVEDLCRERLRLANINLSISEIPDVEVDAEASKLQQIIMSLLNNACDAVSPYEGSWIRIDFEASDSRIRIIVTDSGKGIDSAIRDRIFDPFFTTKEFGKSSGLGLSIARGLAKEQNGDLYFDPTASHTRFVLEIQRAS